MTTSDQPNQTAARPRDELVAALRDDALPPDRMPGFIDVGIATWRDEAGARRYGRHFVSLVAFYQKGIGDAP